jgi:hypothetical protein
MPGGSPAVDREPADPPVPQGRWQPRPFLMWVFGTHGISLHETRGGSVGAALVLTLTEPWRDVAGW